jgi:hypothetical protein
VEFLGCEVGLLIIYKIFIVRQLSIIKVSRNEDQKLIRHLQRDIEKNKTKQDTEKNKTKIDNLKEALKEEKKNRDSIPNIHISRHKFKKLEVDSAVELNVLCGCSLRSVVKVLKLLVKKFNLGLSDIPSYTSVKNWLEKSGYNVYQDSRDKKFPNGYALLQDECMMMGGQKLFMTLGVPQTKTTEKALSRGDVRILNMGVKLSWNSENIGAILEQQSQTMGLSEATAAECLVMLSPLRSSQHTRVRAVGEGLAEYIK